MHYVNAQRGGLGPDRDPLLRRYRPQERALHARYAHGREPRQRDDLRRVRLEQFPSPDQGVALLPAAKELRCCLEVRVALAQGFRDRLGVRTAIVHGGFLESDEVDAAKVGQCAHRFEDLVEPQPQQDVPCADPHGSIVPAILPAMSTSERKAGNGCFFGIAKAAQA